MHCRVVQVPPPLSEGRFDHQPLSRETRSRHSSHHTLELQFDLNMVRSIAHLNLYSYTPTLTHVANTYIHPSIHNPPRLLWGAWTQTCFQAPSKCPHSCSCCPCAVRGHIYGVTQGRRGLGDPRTSQCNAMSAKKVPSPYIHYFCLFLA